MVGYLHVVCMLGALVIYYRNQDKEDIAGPLQAALLGLLMPLFIVMGIVVAVAVFSLLVMLFRCVTNQCSSKETKVMNE
jgi:hypothetical protein